MQIQFTGLKFYTVEENLKKMFEIYNTSQNQVDCGIFNKSAKKALKNKRNEVLDTAEPNECFVFSIRKDSEYNLNSMAHTKLNK